MDNLKKSGKYNCICVIFFKEFLNNEDVPFTEITYLVLNRYRAYLKGTRTIGERTIVNHLIVIRSIFKFRQLKGIWWMLKFYPFGSDKVQIKFPDLGKNRSCAEEIKQLEELVLLVCANEPCPGNIQLLPLLRWDACIG